MWNNQKQQKRCFPLCQTYKPTVILNYISKKWTDYTGGKWLIHGTKRRKDNQLQSHRVLLEYKSNLKNSWQVIKTVINKRKYTPVNTKFQVNGATTNDVNIIAKKINTFFSIWHCFG